MKLKELRLAKGVTQKEVAEYLCCTPLAYSRYERETRMPSIPMLNSMADYFCVSIDDLVGRTKT